MLMLESDSSEDIKFLVKLLSELNRGSHELRALVWIIDKDNNRTLIRSTNKESPLSTRTMVDEDNIIRSRLIRCLTSCGRSELWENLW